MNQIKFVFVFVLGFAATVTVARAQEMCVPSVQCQSDPALRRTCCQVTGPVAERPPECRSEVVCKDDAAEAQRVADERMNSWRAEAVAHVATAQNARLEAELALCRPENCHDYHLGAVDNNRQPTKDECRLLQGRWEGGERCNMCNSPLYLARQRRVAQEDRRVVKQATKRERPRPQPARVVEFTLTIMKQGDGDGVSDPVEGNHQYRQGTRVQLLASPHESSNFDGWTGRGCGEVVVMNRNRTCTATFNLIPPPPPPPPPPTEPEPTPPPPPEPPPPPPPSCEEIRACGEQDLTRIAKRTREAWRMARVALRTVHAGVFVGGYFYQDPTMRTSGLLGGVDLRLRLYEAFGVYSYGFGVAISNSAGAGAGIYGQISLSRSATLELRAGGEWTVLDVHTGERRTRTPRAEVAGPTATVLFQRRVSRSMALRIGVRAGFMFREHAGPRQGSDGFTLQVFLGPEFGIF